MWCFSLVLILLFNYSYCGEFPKEVKKCNYGDTDCIRDVATEILRKYPNGYPELVVPNLEPFIIDRFDLSQGGDGPVSFNLTITDSHFYGLSKMNITKVVGFDKDFTKSKFEIYGTVPKLINKSKYKISGRMLIFPVQGDGDSYNEMENVRISIKSKPKLSMVKNGKSYMKIDRYKVWMDIDKMKINMTNLFNGDQVLGDNMNKIMNDNWKIMWDEFSPAISKIAADFTKDIINDMFDKFAYEEVFANN